MRVSSKVREAVRYDALMLTITRSVGAFGGAGVVNLRRRPPPTRAPPASTSPSENAAVADEKRTMPPTPTFFVKYQATSAPMLKPFVDSSSVPTVAPVNVASSNG